MMQSKLAQKKLKQQTLQSLKWRFLSPAEAKVTVFARYDYRRLLTPVMKHTPASRSTHHHSPCTNHHPPLTTQLPPKAAKTEAFTKQELDAIVAER